MLARPVRTSVAIHGSPERVPLAGSPPLELLILRLSAFTVRPSFADPSDLDLNWISAALVVPLNAGAIALLGGVTLVLMPAHWEDDWRPDLSWTHPSTVC